MKIRYKVILFFIGFIGLLTGCKTGRQTTTSDKLEYREKQQLIELVEQNTLSFHTFSARVQADIRIGEKVMGSKAELKMIHDSLITLSVQPFLGIELFRLELTPNQVLVIDRMKKRYVCEEYASLREEYGIDFNFSNLQALFTNRLFVPGKEGMASAYNKLFRLQKTDTGNCLKLSDKMNLDYSFTIDQEDKLTLTQISGPDELFLIDWNYIDFNPIEKAIFPSLMQITVQSKGIHAGSLTLSFSRIRKDVEVNSQKNLPVKYKQVKLKQLLQEL